MTDEHERHSGGSSFEQVLVEYESAWSQRQEDGSEPVLEIYLQRVPATDRPALKAALERIAGQYQGGPPDEPSLVTETVASTIDLDSPPRDTSVPQETDATTAMSAPSSAGGRSTSQEDAAPSATRPVSPENASGETVEFDSTSPASSAAPERGESATLGPETITGRPQLQLEGYELLGELGRGGMGVVFKARETTTQRLVCIKMMLAGEYASPDAVRRFQVETEAAASLDHPNIVPIYRAGETRGIPFFVMKFVDGKPLNKAQREDLTSDPRTVSQLMSKICQAVHFAHARGILHRDLKPANILLDNNGEPHITDFGLAKKIDDDAGQTRTGMIMGTPDYMSPEQAVGRNDLVTVTSDVYALGSVLFDLLTGQPPFKSATIVETLTRVTKEPARAPTMLNKRVGRDLETICLKCLEKDPAKRYQSAAAVAEELQRYLQGEPILGRPVSSSERAWRWCRRNPVLSALSAASLILLTTVAIGSSIAAYQISEQRNVAVEARQEADDAKQRALQSAEVADEQRTLALDTLYSLVTSVESKFQDRADLSDLQTEILQDALNGLQKVSRTAEISGRADRTVGVAYQRMAGILNKMGKTEEAIEQHRNALEIFEQLMETDPSDDWARWNAAISYDRLGDYVLGTDASAAADWYRKSTALRDQLAETTHSADLSSIQRQHALAISAAKIGQLTLMQGQPAQAREYFAKALAQSEAMLRADPDNQQARMAVAGSCTLLGNVCFRLGQRNEAHDYYHQALEMRKELQQRDPQSVTASNLLAKSYDVLGDFELQTGQTEDARQYYEQASELLDTIYRRDQKNAVIKGDLSTMYYKLATTHLRLGQPDKAKPTFAKCLALREELAAIDAENSQRQIALMLAQARCGQHDKASEWANQLATDAAENAGTLFYVACGYALSAGAVADQLKDAPSNDEATQLKKRYETSAIETLEKAVTLGYRDVVSLQTDPDLDAVRQLPEFQKLLDTLGKDTAKGSRPESQSEE